MGIRIHKILGYGLTNVIADTDNWDLRNDPRFNPEGYLFEREDIKHLKVFIKDFKKKFGDNKEAAKAFEDAAKEHRARR